jgi:hypothetical protein
MHPAYRVIQPSRPVPHAFYGTASPLYRPDREAATSIRTDILKERHHRIIDWQSSEIRSAITATRIGCEKKLKEISKNPQASIGDPFPDEMLRKAQEMAKKNLLKSKDSF